MTLQISVQVAMKGLPSCPSSSVPEPTVPGTTVSWEDLPFSQLFSWSLCSFCVATSDPWVWTSCLGKAGITEGLMGCDRSEDEHQRGSTWALLRKSAGWA